MSSGLYWGNNMIFKKDILQYMVVCVKLIQEQKDFTSEISTTKSLQINYRRPLVLQKHVFQISRGGGSKSNRSTYLLT